MNLLLLAQGLSLKTPSVQNQTALSRLKLFGALSRTPHGLLDMATPGLSSLLWLGTFPPPAVIGLGLMTAFSGYTAVYTLNDVIDYRVDQKKIQGGKLRSPKHDLDSVFVRHPMAHGMLGHREGIYWMGGWALLALIGSFLLHPLCTLIFLIACLLEIIYCLLLRMSYLRGMISGAVKSSGGIAAVFAVDPNPDPLFLVVLSLWLFFWEIGGQNIPNDWADLDEDRELQAQTFPVRFGPQGSLAMIYFSLFLSLALSLAMDWVAPGKLGLPYLAGALVSGFYFLLLPAHRLYKTKASEEASTLFNRASYYPLAMLLVTIISWKF
jgi:4-hydroxybenzoate polyprenyltransferase